jgi:hypothetical protein
VYSRLAPTNAGVTARQQADTARPAPEQLRRYVELPSDFPTAVGDEARRVVTEAGASTPYAQAEALRDYFWANFTYDVTVDARDDTDAISNFLRDGRGFCVQFASAYAVMARSLGIPARVAVGFTQGDFADGVYTVKSHNAHAWPEIYLAGLGWTHLFDPTPPADTNPLGQGSALPGDPPLTSVTTPGQTIPTTPPSTAPASPSDGNDGSGSTSATATTSVPVPPRVSASEPAGGTRPWIVVLVVLAALVLCVVLYVAFVLHAKARRRARRHDADAAAAVQGAWEEALDRLREAHVPPDPALTPLELARSAPERGVTAATRPLRTLARAYTIVRYSDHAPSAADADQAWASVAELDRALDVGLTRRERWRRRLDPSTLRIPARRSR